MLAARQPGGAAWLLSALLHVAVIAMLWWSAAPAVLQTPPPLAVELWAGGGPVVREAVKAARAAVSKPQPAAPAPTPAPTPAAQAQLPALNSADITVKGGKPAPEPAAPPPAKTPAKPKPAPAEPAKATPPVPASKPAVTAAPTGKPAAKPVAPRADDLLSELDDLPPGPGKGKVTQSGSKQGVQGGSANGVLDLRAQYVDAVRNRIRPYVMVPDGIAGNPEAVVEVEILPTLEIRSSRLLRSSGVAGYDQAVLAALRDARRFPPLPKGADFADFRRITLKFRPKE
ncbi:energy transducer TonB [Vogesella oryzae]|uniref:energy transducer TonB n=1 Tax=Vogesella oryzae TaxID=1735285 RepID=UPI0015822756|nr:energy transducer TonB [Vogesella oryzae]